MEARTVLNQSVETAQSETVDAHVPPLPPLADRAKRRRERRERRR
jgi:hypothetical protein